MIPILGIIPIKPNFVNKKYIKKLLPIKKKKKRRCSQQFITKKARPVNIKQAKANVQYNIYKSITANTIPNASSIMLIFRLLSLIRA